MKVREKTTWNRPWDMALGTRGLRLWEGERNFYSDPGREPTNSEGWRTFLDQQAASRSDWIKEAGSTIAEWGWHLEVVNIVGTHKGHCLTGSVQCYCSQTEGKKRKDIEGSSCQQNSLQNQRHLHTPLCLKKKKKDHLVLSCNFSNARFLF